MRKSADLSQRTEIARQLHLEFNTALSNGDVKRIQSLACEGLVQHARTRVGRRRSYGRLHEPWAIVKYLGIRYPAWLQTWPISTFLPRATTRVVSDKIIPLPMAESYVRQCTVRINSLQKYIRADETRELLMIHTDYVVIQKLTVKGEEMPWMMWGTVEPSTMEQIDALLKGKGEDSTTTIADRIQERWSTMTGI